MKAIRDWFHGRAARAGDRGVTSIEYAGIVILVAGIVIAVRALGLDATISSSIATWVNAVLGT
ncbi:hypothetical protein [Streptomyces sp. JJ36]|uniref:hypothetical protein n=1 Tax=Streptomyces sp. JJ36 TaxID=2736645 RepID=UPI001F317301|nr:hypothetical protein [Streptomyces sp. JJ36]MCF6522026.1 hypothetical protein [Streptomyces sp. JJ36]